MKHLIICLIRGYQIVLSPWLGGCCRFVPSCSEYALRAIKLHGARHGGLLGLKRLLCCHPLHAGGYDPVPERSVPYSRGKVFRS